MLVILIFISTVLSTEKSQEGRRLSSILYFHSSTEWIWHLFLYNGPNLRFFFFFFTEVKKNTANSVGSLGHTPRGERRKSFLPLVPGSSLGFILWPMNMGCEAYLEPSALVLGRKRLCLLSSNHYYTRLQGAVPMFYTSLKIYLMFASVSSIPFICLHT